MECEKCNSPLAQADACQHLGKTLCEDCYMDALSPTRTCDPWAQYNAKSFQGKPLKLCPTQERILEVLESQGPMSPEHLVDTLAGDWSRATLEREYATLKRLEKIRAVKGEDGILLRLW